MDCLKFQKGFLSQMNTSRATKSPKQKGGKKQHNFKQSQSTKDLKTPVNQENLSRVNQRLYYNRVSPSPQPVSHREPHCHQMEVQPRATTSKSGNRP